MALQKIYINGVCPGYLVGFVQQVVVDLLQAQALQCALDE